MKIEKLTDNKIRIIINIDELIEKNINPLKLSENNSQTQSLLKTILNEAEKQLDFKVQNCKVLIEAFSTTEDYIVFTLTKYKNEADSEKKLKIKRKTFEKNYKNSIYKFKTFEEFSTFCTYCSNSPLNDLANLAKTVALYEYKNNYYLILSEISTNFKYTKLFYTSIAEFSDLVSNSRVFISELIEHGNVVFKSKAIKECIKYFSKI